MSTVVTRQPSLCGVFVGTDVTDVSNISSSRTEMANPREKCYWILIMHTASLRYQSKQRDASGQMVYFDNQRHEK